MHLTLSGQYYSLIAYATAVATSLIFNMLTWIHQINLERLVGGIGFLSLALVGIAGVFVERAIRIYISGRKQIDEGLKDTLSYQLAEVREELVDKNRDLIRVRESHQWIIEENERLKLRIHSLETDMAQFGREIKENTSAIKQMSDSGVYPPLKFTPDPDQDERKP